jgi:hypothetical protein
LTAGSGEFIDAGAAAVFGLDPRGFYELVALQAMEGGVKGAFLDAQEAFGDGLDVEGDAKAMIGATGERFEDEEIERS